MFGNKLAQRLLTLAIVALFVAFMVLMLHFS
jgi:hypothetical protein